MKKKMLLAMVLLLAVFASFGQDKTDNGQTTETDFEIDRMGTIMKYLGPHDRAITIPAQIGGIKVIAFKDYLFYMDNLTGVTIPAGVMFIGNRAFTENKLTTIIIPDGVMIIGFRAFSDNRLTTVNIANSVTSIGHSAFRNNVISSVTLPAGLTAINTLTFAYNRLASINIPRTVTSIGDYTFASNYLTSITLPDSVKRIGKGAFAENRERSYPSGNLVVYGKNLLTTITIGANVILAGGVEPSFDDGFDNFYNLNGKQAGTYILINGRWNMAVRK